MTIRGDADWLLRYGTDRIGARASISTTGALAATGANSLCPVDVVTSQRVNDGHIKPLFIEYEIDHMVTLSGAPPDRHGSRRVSQYQPTVCGTQPTLGSSSATNQEYKHHRHSALCYQLP